MSSQLIDLSHEDKWRNIYDFFNTVVFVYYGTCWATQPTVTFGPQIRGKTVFTLILDEIIQKMDDFIITNFLST